MTHISPNFATLTEKIEEIAFSNSALPPSPSADSLSEIIYNLNNHWHSKRLSACHVFGANSLCSHVSSFLISQKCPSSSFVENSFAAASAHSELGKMFEWFAQSVVRLFVHGVESGVRFPREWERAVRERPALNRFAFELQGFGALFTYVLCHLAAVEAATATAPAAEAQRSPAEAQRSLAEAQRGPAEAQRGPAEAQRSPAEAQRSPAEAQRSLAEAQRGPAEAQRSPAEAQRSLAETQRGPGGTDCAAAEAVRGRDESVAPNSAEADGESCEVQSLVDEVLESAPETKVHKGKARDSSVRLAWGEPQPEIHVVDECVLMGNTASALPPPSKNLQSLVLSTTVVEAPMPSEESMGLGKGLPFQQDVRFQGKEQKQQQPQHKMGVLLRNKLVRNPRQNMSSLEPPSLEIRSTRFDPAVSKKTDTFVSPISKEPPDTLHLESISPKRHVGTSIPARRKVEAIEEKERARELRKLCGSKKIVNYSKRDAQTCGDHVKLLREILRAQCDESDEENDNTEDSDVVHPILFPEP